MHHPFVFFLAALASLLLFLAAFCGAGGVFIAAVHAADAPILARVVMGGVGTIACFGLAMLGLQGWGWGLRQLFQDPPKPPEVIPMYIQVGPKGTVF